MSDQTVLEGRYRRLLACYPAAFRREHEEEMLAVVLAAAGDRRRPALADTVNLVWHGLRLRVAPRTRRSVPTVFWAVRLLLLAACLELVAMVAVVSSQSAVRTAVLRRVVSGNAGQAVALVHSQVVAIEIGAPIAAVAWLVLAWANDHGYRWGRVGAVLLLGLTTLSLLSSVARHSASVAPVDLIAGIVLWVTALAAAALIISAESSRHYRPSRPGSRRDRSGTSWVSAAPRIATGSRS